MTHAPDILDAAEALLEEMEHEIFHMEDANETHYRVNPLKSKANELRAAIDAERERRAAHNHIADDFVAFMVAKIEEQHARMKPK